MASLTKNRLTVQNGGSGDSVATIRLSIPIADNVHIFQGALVQVDSGGHAIPAGAGVATVGRAEKEYDNTIVGHAVGLLKVECRQGAFLWDIGTAGDALTQANVMAPVYAIDDHTVGLTTDTGTKVKAGIFLGLDETGTQAIVQTIAT